MNSIFNKLVQRNGTYSLPYLIHIYDKKNESQRTYDMYFVNSRKDIQFERKTYKSGAFSYSSNNSENGFSGGGKLEIAIKDNQIVNLIDSSESIYLDVIGAINSKGIVQKIKTFNHHFGKITGNKTKITIQFEKDDRQAMTFPSLIWSSLNNRGNA